MRSSFGKRLSWSGIIVAAALRLALDLGLRHAHQVETVEALEIEKTPAIV